MLTSPQSRQDFVQPNPPRFYDGWSSGSSVTTLTGTLPIEWNWRARSWTNTSSYTYYRKSLREKLTVFFPVNLYKDEQRKSGYSNFVANFKQTGARLAGWTDGTVQAPYLPQFTGNEAAFLPLYNKCIKKFPRKMNGSQFNLPLFLAEAHKSVKMIREAATSIREVIEFTTNSAKSKYGYVIREVNGKKVKVFNQTLIDREVHNMWLEYRYGWRLLLKDCLDSLKAVHDRRTMGTVQRVKATEFSSVELPDYSFEIGAPNYNSRVILNVKAFKRTIRYDVGITLYFKESSTTLGSLQQFGITNPLTLAWELIPYSFVVDWFVPVGDYLSGLDAYLGKVFSSGVYTRSAERKESYVVTGGRFDTSYRTGTVYNASSSPWSSSSRFWKREPLSSFPSLELPWIDVNLNASRATDAISLLLQRKGDLLSAFNRRR